MGFRIIRSCIYNTIVALALMLNSSLCLANPEGGVISAGEAAITESGSNVTINQASDKAVIDWKSFDIAPTETTKFNQPSKESITLNRIHSDNASTIAGKLTANGNIVLVNQNGFLFTKDAVVDVNSIIATTSDINNDNFMKGKMEFNKPGNPDAMVINEGSITAKEAGLIGMVAPQVINNGHIVANGGRVQLSSGDTFTLDMYGDKLMEVAVSKNLKKQLVRNKGIIKAKGGKIILTAAAGKEIVDGIIEVEGELKAPAAGLVDGEIKIYAEGSNAVPENIPELKNIKKGKSKVQVAAKLNVSGRKKGEKGGKISIMADEVHIKDKTIIDASGSNGITGTTEALEVSAERNGSAGGDIRIGGDYKGGGATPTAEKLIVEPGAEIYSDSLEAGDAGRNIFWADGETYFYGNSYSRALGDIGDGGFIETSGHRSLIYRGKIDPSTKNGNPGTWFLDPANLTITNADANLTNGVSSPFLSNGAGNATVNAADIKTILDANSNVIVSTGADGFASSGDITVSSAISTTGTGNLTLSAYRDININAAITLAGGALSLTSDNASNSSGAVNVSANVSSGGGSITMTGGSGYAYGRTDSAGGVTISGAFTVNAGGGNITMNGKGYAGSVGADYGIYNNGGTIGTTGIGKINITGIGGGSNNVASIQNYGIYHAGTIQLSAGNVAGAINITGTGANYTGEQNDGIRFFFGSVISDYAPITIIGTGGSYSHRGISTQNLTITSTNAATISVTGTSGTNAITNGVGAGIALYSSSITGSGGTITMNGTGGGSLGTGISNDGINFDGVTVSNTSAAINMTGTGGGSAAGNFNKGISIYHVSSISTTTGAISLTGTGGDGNGSSKGVDLDSSTSISSTGNTITITGTGGGTSGASNHGVEIHSGTTINSAANATTITGQYGFGGKDIYLSQNIATTGTTNLVSSCAPCGTIYVSNAYTLAGNMVINAGASGTTQFNNTLDGAKTLNITASTITPNGSWGSGSPLGNITFNSGFTIGADLTATSSATTNFTSTVDGANNLNINSATITQGGAIGSGTALSSLSFNQSSGSISVPFSIKTTGAISISSYVDINVNTSLTASGGNITLTSDNASNSSGAVNVSANISSGGGNITMTGGSGYAYGDAAYNPGITINNTVNAAGGNIIMNGYGSAVAGGFNVGIANFSTIQTTGTGSINMTGYATTSTACCTHGINFSGSSVQSQTGSITITGYGAPGTNSNDWGLAIQGGSSISSAGGTITLNGTGGGGAGGGNFGVFISSSVSNTGTGQIIINGIGGTAAAGTNNHGIYLLNGGVSTQNGLITLIGTASSGTDSIGIKVSGSGSVASSGSTISLNGTGGGTAGANHGVQIDSGTTISSAASTTTITGQYGFGGNDIYLNENISTSGTTNLVSNCAPCGKILILPSYILTGPTIINSGTGTVQFSNKVNGYQNLDLYAATISPTSGSSWGSVTALGNVTFHNNFSLTSNLNLASQGVVNFAGTVDGAQNLTTSAVTITLGGALGASTPLGDVSLITSSYTNLLLNQNITASSIVARTTSSYANLNVSAPLITSSSTPNNTNYGIILAAGNDFINSSTLTTASNIYWAIYTGDTSSATNITKGGLVGTNYYGCTYNSGSPACTTGAAVNNSEKNFFFAYAPTLSITDLSASNKIYDATTNVTINGSATLSGLLNGDTLSLNGSAVGNFSDKNVANNKLIPITGYSVTPQLGYVLSSLSLTANITPATLTVSGSKVTSIKLFDFSNSAAINGGTIEGLLPGDNVMLNQAASYSSSSPGYHTITVNDTISGLDAGNYLLTEPSDVNGIIYPDPIILNANLSDVKNLSIFTASSTDTILIFLQNDFCYLDSCHMKQKLDIDETNNRKKRRKL